MLTRIFKDIVLALGFMTRLPVPAFSVSKNRRLSQAFWAMPLAGALIGALTAGIFIATSAVGLDHQIAAALALGAMALITGGLHDDGLADFWDGIGGGKTPGHRLEIMRDSRIGTYGVLALVITYALLVGVLSAIASHASDAETAIIIIVCTMLSRTALAIPMVLLAPARDDGLGKLFGRPSMANIVVGTLWPLAVAATLAPEMTLVILAAIVVGAVVTTALARRYLGGHTGDVLGAVIMTSFAAGLLGARLML